MRRAAAVVVVLTLLLAGACSDSDDAKDPVKSENDTGGDDGAKADATSADQLEAKLLTIDDLPEGWTLDPSSDDDDDSDEDDSLPECLKHVKRDEEDHSTASADADFIQGKDFPSLSESFKVYPADEIDERFDTAAGHLDTCGDFRFTSDDIEFTGSMSRVASFPQLGDSSGAWRMQVEAQGFTFDFAIVFIQQDDVAATVFYRTQGGDAAAEVQPLAELAAGKL